MDRVQVAHQPNRVFGWVGRTRDFLVGVREEMKKVTWPTRDELIKATRMIVVLSIVAVLCLSAAIVGLAVGLGAVHPQFDAADGTEVAAGYAGILFMMSSAVLVLFSVTVLAWPVYHSFRARWLGWSPGAGEWGGVAGGLAAVAGVSLIALVTAMRRGRHSLETIDA